MSRPVLEVADIFRDHAPAWRRAMQGHLSHDQLKVMSAIEGKIGVRCKELQAAVGVRGLQHR